MKKLLVILAIIVLSILGFYLVPSHETNKTLVAYFSATRNTENVAQKLAEAIDADLFVIKPVEPYTSQDLNWRNAESRTSIEMTHRASRPAIATKVENIAKYNFIFVGFPIWWGREPSIIDTFIESYNFTGKTIIPFATSGSTPTTDVAAADIRSLAPNANVLNGKRFPTDVSIEELKTWANTQFQID